MKLKEAARNKIFDEYEATLKEIDKRIAELLGIGQDKQALAGEIIAKGDEIRALFRRARSLAGMMATYLFEADKGDEGDWAAYGRVILGMIEKLEALFQVLVQIAVLNQEKTR